MAPVCLLRIESAVAQSDRIDGAFDNDKTVVVEGHRQPLARAEFDCGAVPPDFALRGMTLTVRRTAAQQSGLDRLLAAQQNPSSPNYHNWLTPEQFGDRFGASPTGLASLEEWLKSQGFEIKAVARARTFIRFDATAEQVRQAFGTEIHHYAVNGVMHYANAGPPSLPAALAPLVLGVGGMDDFGPHPDHAVFLRRKKGAVAPDYSYSDGSLNALAPADLAAIYDIGGLATPVPDGAGQTVVIIGSSDVSTTDLQLYCSTFSADPACGTAFTFAYPGEDPGTSNPDWAAEETMDLELVSAVAPGAALVLDVDTTVWNALYDAIDSNRGQVISMSFGVCEKLVDASLVTTIQAAAQEANALGITLIASSGDSGGAGCDAGPLSGGGAHGPAVDLPASLPEATGVGGTEFDEGSGAYWTSGTATEYIPEKAWNDTTATASLAASGGGVSTLFTKPAWQSGTGVPADGQRDVPDVALAASGVHDGYVIAIDGGLSTAGDSPYTMGGTSAAAAVFAGMVALLNESLGSSSGNINAALYTIAAGGSGATAFHDITTGNNIVPCASDAVGCTSSPSQLGWNAGAGYDLATGLGSVDQYQLLEAWPAGYDAIPAIDNLSPSTAGAGSGSQPIAITGTGFTNLSSVTWTASSLTTQLASSCASATSCTATVPASLLTTPGAGSIRVLSASGLNSPPATFTIARTPTITSLSPNSAVAGSGGFTLTVAGTNFVSSSTVMWGGAALATTYGGPTSLTAAVTSAQLASAGWQNVTVQNPTGVSSVSTFMVNGPAIGSLSPVSAIAGGAFFTLTVTGTNFASGSTVMWNGTALATTYGSPTSLTATITSTQLISAGQQEVTVQDAYGVSTAYPFPVNGPTIGSLSPSAAVAGSGGFTLTVAGTNFVNSSTVYWGATPLTTTYGGATSLTANVTSTQLASAGPQNVTVQNSTAASSAASTFTVSGPTIASLSVLSVAAGTTTPTTITITGANFIAVVTDAGGNYVSGSLLYAGATALAVTAGTATSITATIAPSLVASAGRLSLTVHNPGGAMSAAFSLTVAGPAITSLVPSSAVAGGAAFTLTVTGTNFVSSSTVMWGTTALATTYGSGTSLTAAVTSAQLASAGPQNVSVENSSTASSSASTFPVNGPTITLLSPSSAVAGSAPLTLTVTGMNFVSGSKVYWGASPLATSYLSPTSLTAAVTSAQLGSAGSPNVTVQNSSTAVSSASSFLVSGPTITSLSPTSAVAGGALFTLTVTGTNFVSGSKVYWGATPLATVYVGETSLTATVTSTQLASSGSPRVTVQNSSTASSSACTFMVNGPAIASLSPNLIAAGSSLTAITVTGANFVPVTIDAGGNYVSGSLVYAGSTALPVTAGSATSITATIPPRLVASAGGVSLTVHNPGGATSAAASLTVAAPTIASLSSTSAVAGSAPFTLTVTGTNFVSGSTVMWSTTALATTYGNATSLTAAVASAQLAATGPQNVTVQNTSSASSSASRFTVEGPTITALSRISIAAGAAPFTLTVTGINFVSGSTVMWNATPLTTNPTTPGSTTSLTAAVTSTQLASAGSAKVTVKNASAASSSASTFTVNGPTLASVSPTSIAAGSSSATITVTGANFVAETTDAGGNYVSGSLVYAGATALAVTAGTATSITANLPASMVASTGQLILTVQNPGGGTSAASTLTIAGPTITSLSPSSAAAGGAAFTLTVTGTNFVSSSTVMWGATALATTYGSATSLTAAVTSTQVASAGPAKVTVKNSSSASSSASTFTVNGPTITSISPSSAAAGGNSFTLTVTGTNFVSSSTVMWGATALATTYGSATSLTAAVASAQVASAGPAKVTVKNSSSASSSASTFTVNGPTITSLSPSSAAAGGNSFTLTVTGTNFVNGSTVMWGATALATTYGGATSLTAAVTSAQLASTGSEKVTVKNSSTASSSASTFTVSRPTIASLSPTSATAGGTSFTLSVTGTNFVNGSTVMWGATALATTYVSATSLTAAVTSTQLASAGSAKVTVENSSTVSSAASTFTVNGL